MGVDICIVDDSLDPEKQTDGATGYIRSSYNSQGLFRVLDKIYGIDVGAMLFPGDWEQDLNIDFEKYLAHLRTLEFAAAELRDGDRLPIKGTLLESVGPLGARKQPSLIFKMGIWFLNRISAKSEREEAIQLSGKTYRDAIHGPLVRQGLKELRDFGELGRRLSKNGNTPVVSISF